MSLTQFKKWLESRIHWLRGLQDYQNPDDLPAASALLEEAYQRAIDLNLPECAAACRPGPVTIRLLECLNAIPSSDVLTPPEIAEQLSTSPETVLGWIKSGQLKASNLATGNRPRYVVMPDDLKAFLKTRQPEPPAKRKPKAKATGSYKRFSE